LRRFRSGPALRARDTHSLSLPWCTTGPPFDTCPLTEVWTAPRACSWPSTARPVDRGSPDDGCDAPLISVLSARRPAGAGGIVGAGGAWVPGVPPRVSVEPA